MNKSPHKTNICFDCGRACGGCPWSAVNPETGKVRFEPVPGWTATPMTLIVGHGKGGAVVAQTYHITACPLFVKDTKKAKRDKTGRRNCARTFY